MRELVIIIGTLNTVYNYFKGNTNGLILMVIAFLAVIYLEVADRDRQ